MMLSVSTGFDPTGTLVLLGGILIALLAYNLKKEKNYKAAMAEYEQAMKKLEQAVAVKRAPVPKAAGGPDAETIAAVSAAAVASAEELRKAVGGLDPETVAVVSAAAVAAAEELQKAAVSGGEVLLTGVDEPTAALLIAIVANAAGENPSALRFVSIKAL